MPVNRPQAGAAFISEKAGQAGAMTKERASGYELGDSRALVSALKRLFVLSAGAIAIAIALAPNAQAQHGETVMTCTNPNSGASWQIRIDYDHRTVDGYPARISEGSISWYQIDNHGNYTFDRKSGELTIVTPSTTGGYFIYDRCKL
jgi:hypothetical protein